MLTYPYVSPPNQSSSASTPPPSEDTLIGRVIADKFRLGKRIGIGAAGTVYRAEQTSLGRTVAVKVLRPELAGDPRFIRRFHDEALAASRLNHPNVVSVIDFGQTEDGLLYLIMEFLRGVTLTELLRSEELDSKRVSEIIRQILSALTEAHERGVIHADLKSDNILIERRRGGWDLVKVVDFGIARLTGVSTDKALDDDTICGTPEYMAPELISGEDPTPASDIYAVGIVLYELLVGYTPFSGAPVMEVLQRHLNEAPVPPSQRGLSSPIPVYLEQATLQAIQKNPEDRFASAMEFAAALAVDERDTEHVIALTCTDCGTTSSTQNKFCPECGTALPRSAEIELALDDTGYDEFWADDSPTADISAEDLRQLSLSQGGIVEELAAKPERVVPVLGNSIFPLPLFGFELESAAIEFFITGEEHGLLHVQGPSGCGSSRLLRSACEAATSNENVVLLVGADPTGLATAFFPIRSMVGAMLELSPDSSYEDIGIALEEIGLNHRDQPGIGELFEHEGGGLRLLEPVSRRRELFASTMRVFRKFAQKHSAVLAFEDYHLYDRPSQELLQKFAENNHRTPAVHILMTSDENTELGWFEHEKVELFPLGTEELRGVVTHFATRGYPDLLTLDELKQFTLGRPMGIVQLLRYATEGGDLTDIPETLADLVAARIGFLPGVAQRILQAAAVFGQDVRVDDLLEILENSMGRIEMNAAFSLLKERDMLQQEAGMYVFSHRIIRYVIYSSTPKHVHRILHQSAGDILLATTSNPAVLAFHAEQAGPMARAAALLIRAGDHAVRQLNDTGAAAIYHRALKATRNVLLSDEDRGAQLQLITVSIKLADALRAINETRLARGILVEANSHCLQVPGLRAQLFRAEAQLRASEGELNDAISLLRQAIALAIPIFAMDILTDTYLDLATMLLRSGEQMNAVSELEEAVDIITVGEGPSASTVPKNFWRILLRLGQLYGSSQQLDKAIESSHHAARLAESADNSVGAARAYATLAGLYESNEDLKNSQEYRHRAIADMRKLGDRRTTAELLLAGGQPTQTVHRITAGSIREARLLAEEVGWDEGVRRARRASQPVSSEPN